MSWKATAWAKDTRGHRGHSAKLLLMVLADYHDAERDYAWPSQKKLAEDCEMPERTVQYCLAQLESDGFITTTQKGNQYQPSKYRLNFTVAAAQSYEPATSEPATVAPSPEPAMADKVNPQNAASEPAMAVGTSLHEPPLEPPKEKRERQTRQTIIDEQYIQKKVKEFAFLWSEEQVREHIKDALGHSAYRKWDDKQRYVSRWLGNAKPSQNGAHNVNGAKGTPEGLAQLAKFGSSGKT